MSGRTTLSMRGRTSVCRECGKVVKTNATGRPRVTCGHECYQRRRCRLRAEETERSTPRVRDWWGQLPVSAQYAAMAWVNRNPIPQWFMGGRGRQWWAYFNRAEFSCEGRPASGVS